MSRFRKLALFGVLLAGGAVVVPTIAAAGVDIDINVAPPAPRVEVIPGPRPFYAWAPGYWDYRGREHVWVPGHYVHERRGYHWVPDGWEQRGPYWHHVRGHWER